VIACNPIEALSILLIEQENNQDNSATPPPTIYLGIERASQLPIEFLQELDSVIIAIAENSQLARNALRCYRMQNLSIHSQVGMISGYN
jgi:hypothetical protein